MLYVTLGACAVGIALLVRRYDLYISEPIPMVVAAIALGIGAMIIATAVQVRVIHSLAAARVLMTDPLLAVLAGSTEELGKVAVVAAIALGLRRHFDEPIDGLVYGSFAGLGAALIESIWVLRGETLAVLPPQEPIRLAGHVIMGGIGGFGMGLITLRRRGAGAAIVLSYFGAVALHSLWDLVAFTAANEYQRTHRSSPTHSALAVGLMLAGMIAYRWLVGLGARLTRAKLQVCDVLSGRCPPR